MFKFALSSIPEKAKRSDRPTNELFEGVTLYI